MKSEKVLKCPGCKQTIFFDKMDDHFKSDHVEGIRWEAEGVERQGLTGKAKFTRLTWYAQIVIIIQDYPKGFIMWSIILILLTTILAWGRI